MAEYIPDEYDPICPKCGNAQDSGETPLTHEGDTDWIFCNRCKVIFDAFSGEIKQSD